MAVIWKTELKVTHIHKLADNIKMFLKEIVWGIMDYINLADDKITRASC